MMNDDKQWKIKDENLTQRIIDPTTGRDITWEYLKQRLKELEKMADKIISNAIKEFRKDKKNKISIYRKAHNEIHNKLGMGSIGPATAAAGPLMEKKKQKLAEALEIQSEDLV